MPKSRAELDIRWLTARYERDVGMKELNLHQRPWYWENVSGFVMQLDSSTQAGIKAPFIFPVDYAYESKRPSISLRDASDEQAASGRRLEEGSLFNIQHSTFKILSFGDAGDLSMQPRGALVEMTDGYRASFFKGFSKRPSISLRDASAQQAASGRRLEEGSSFKIQNSKLSIPHSTVAFGIMPQLAVSSGDMPQPFLSTWAEIHPTSNIMIVNEMVADPEAPKRAGYVGKEWRGFAGYTRQAFVDCRIRNRGNQFKIELQAGRFYNILGPGRTGQLLLGQTIRPLDQMVVRLKAWGFSFSGGTAELDSNSVNNRFLAYHRLEYQGRWWQIAVNEAILYGGVNRRLEWAYLNPFLFYHGEQMNGPNLSGNTIGSIDARVFLPGHVSLYGEFLVDDYQFDHKVPGDLEPNELGLITGLDWALSKAYVGLEYVAITNRTYKTATPFEWFLHRGIPIGYYPGSDLRRVNGVIRYYYLPKWQIDASMDILWQGEGEMSKPWDEPWMNYTVVEGYSEPFPTGVVERTHTIDVSMTRLWDPVRFVSGGIQYQAVDNLDHIEHQTDSSFLGYLQVSWAIGFANYE